MTTNPNKRMIEIFDTTLRDGEQAPGASLQPEQKIELAHQLASLGIDVIEPGFPISSPGSSRQFRRYRDNCSRWKFAGLRAQSKETSMLQ